MTSEQYAAICVGLFRRLDKEALSDEEKRDAFRQLDEALDGWREALPPNDTGDRLLHSCFLWRSQYLKEASASSDWKQAACHWKDLFERQSLYVSYLEDLIHGRGPRPVA